MSVPYFRRYPVIGLTGYYQDRFTRVRSDKTELDDKLPPLEPMWKSIASAGGVIVFMVAVWIVFR